MEILGPDSGGCRALQGFADGSWGGTFRDEFTPQPGEVVASEHCCSSGFANTDLDMHAQEARHSPTDGDRPARIHLHRLDRSLCGGAGYEVTLVKDAIGSYSWDEMKATLELNAPNYARAIPSTKELIAWLENINA